MWPFDLKIRKAAKQAGVRDLGKAEGPAFIDTELIAQYREMGIALNPIYAITAYIWRCAKCRAKMRNGEVVRGALDGREVRWCPKCYRVAL